MGYDMHITRAPSWWENAGHEIDEAEWRDLVAADPELTITGAAEVDLPDGQTLRYQNELLAEWKAPDGATVWFDFRGGNVVVKNPGDDAIAKMHQLARRLDARVQGEEGEFYD
jgi:hypothetical protein